MAVGVILFGLGWLGIRVMWRRRRQRDVTWLYFRLPGDSRREILRTYGKLQKLLRKKGIEPRRPGQTLEDYARRAGERLPGVEEQLAWFTDAAWVAAYDPGWDPGIDPARSVQEARARLASMKLALG